MSLSVMGSVRDRLMLELKEYRVSGVLWKSGRGENMGENIPALFALASWRYC